MSTSDPYNVVIVGAGLAGALTASTLAEEGLRVVVLEASASLGGTVRRQPGLALLGTPEPFTQLVSRQSEEIAHTIWELTSENLVRLEILLDQFGVASEKTGSLRLATDAKESEALRDSVAQLTRYGYDVGLEDDGRYGDQVAISTTGDLLFSPHALIGKLLDHENITLELGAEVNGVKRQPDGNIAISAHQRYLWAEKVIFANGIHATRLDTRLSELLHPACVHTIALENTNPLTRPLILDDGHVFVLPQGDDAYLIGWDDNEVDILWRLSAIADQICPGALVRERFTTWVAIKDDMLPVVGELPGQQGIYVINGLGPFGLSLALVVADALAELVLYNRQPEIFALEQ